MTHVIVAAHWVAACVVSIQIWMRCFNWYIRRKGPNLAGGEKKCALTELSEVRLGNRRPVDEWKRREDSHAA
jgi:hypothetical protein